MKKKDELKDELKTQSLIAEVAISEYIQKIEDEIKSLESQKKEIRSQFDLKRDLLVKKVKSLAEEYCNEEQVFLNEALSKRYGYDITLKSKINIEENDKFDFNLDNLEVEIQLSIFKARKNGDTASVDNHGLELIGIDPWVGPIYGRDPYRRRHREEIKENRIGLVLTTVKKYENLTEFTETKDLYLKRQALNKLIEDLRNETYKRNQSKEKIELKFKTKVLESDKESKELLEEARKALPSIDSLKKQLTTGESK
jgi:hypothetical protein